MDKIMEKLNKLSLPAVILIASVMLGSFYFASQVAKQSSIERQQEIKIEQEKQDQLAKELKEKQVKEEAEQALNTCVADAETKRNNSIISWKDYEDKTCVGLSMSGEIYCLQGVLDGLNKAKAEEKEDKAECFKRYPQK